MKPHEWYQKTLEEVRDTLEYELEGVLIELTEQIVRHMEREGINRSQLAKKLGVSSAYITKLLSGHPNMTLETVVKVARALKCEVYLSLESRHILFMPQVTESFIKKEYTVTVPLAKVLDGHPSAAAA